MKLSDIEFEVETKLPPGYVDIYLLMKVDITIFVH